MSNIQVFDENIAKSIETGLVLVDFFADWCMPCKLMLPILDQVAIDMRNKITIGKIDTDAYGDVIKEYDIRSLPTLVLFKDGKEVKRLIGLRQADDIKSAIEEYL